MYRQWKRTAVVTVAIDSFMMVKNPAHDMSKSLERLQNLDADFRVTLHNNPFVRIQLSGLVQDRLRNAQFAHIMHQSRIFQANRIDATLDGRRQIFVEKHGQALHMAAVAVQVRVTGIDNAHQNLSNIDTSGFSGFKQPEHKCQNYGYKDAPAKEDHRHHNVRLPHKRTEQVAHQEKAQQDSGNNFPDAVTMTPCRKHIVGAFDKKEIPDDVYHHQNSIS